MRYNQQLLQQDGNGCEQRSTSPTQTDAVYFRRMDAPALSRRTAFLSLNVAA
jgi:hypothetical protein